MNDSTRVHARFGARRADLTWVRYSVRLAVRRPRTRPGASIALTRAALFPSSSTTRRVPLRILLRAPGVEARLLAHRFEGYSVVILGFANMDDWGGLGRDGDLEGFVWVSPALWVNDAIEDLRSFPEVVDARIAPRDVSAPRDPR